MDRPAASPGEATSRTRLDRGFYYRAAGQEEAFARLRYLVAQQYYAGWVSGAQGSGKSLVLSHFHRELRKRGIPTALVNPAGLDARELLAAIADQLGTPYAGKGTTSGLWRQIEGKILESRVDPPMVLLIDDLHFATSAAQTAMVRWIEYATVHRARATMILAADPERLRSVQPRLIERVQLRVDLPHEPRDPRCKLAAHG